MRLIVPSLSRESSMLFVVPFYTQGGIYIVIHPDTHTGRHIGRYTHLRSHPGYTSILPPWIPSQPPVSLLGIP